MNQRLTDWFNKGEKMRKLGWVPIIILVCLPLRLAAESACLEKFATVISVQGVVEKKDMDETDWKSVKPGTELCSSDSLKTLKNSRATIDFVNQTVVSLDQNTTLLFAKQEDDSFYGWLVELFTGKAFFRSRKPHQLKIHTPFVNAAHKGTEFMVAVEPDKATILVFDGKVSADNSLGKVIAKKGQQAIALKDQAPQISSIKISPEDAVQWTLYYPPVLDNNTAGGRSLDSGSTEHFNRQAAQFLNVGRVNEAQAAIDQAKSLSPDNASSVALEAVIAVAKNRADQAFNLASQAVKQDPQSVTAALALSYSLQAQFKLEQALLTMERSVRQNPSNALAWSRLAELQLSVGDQDNALESAKKAEQLNPALSRTQVVLGFADLANIDTTAAQHAFEQAIQIDSADPLARLGLGLAKVRQGDIEAGTRDMEAAVSLDPDNAVIRSYLGKAYYELKNTSYATTELTIAKENDPKDPTPWFYDAILKQTTNRPVEALHDMQQAITLNDNRAVYRSSLLLDQDLAARSATLGRIYNDLGFQQRGLYEGWTSLNTDPSNYSAHRLLADNYGSRTRHEITRTSELLQSQLLQPINLTPVQPRLAESNLLILDGTGPSNSSFNEYNPLFMRNRLALQASGTLGNNDQWGDEVILSGLKDKFSFSLGQYHYETDGFRENNFLQHDIYNAFFQVAVTDKLSLQTEYRHRESEQGDLQLNFDPTRFSTQDFRTTNQDKVRVGLHYAPTQQADFLLAGSYQKGDRFVRNFLPISPGPDTPPIGNLINDQVGEEEGFDIQGQFIYQWDHAKAIAGFGSSHVGVDLRISQDYTQVAGTPCVPQLPSCDFFPARDVDHNAGYLYSYLTWPHGLTWTAGVSYDDASQGPIDISRFNPKGGLQWKVTESTTFRWAYLQTVKRVFIAEQNLEPTQVAGFAQQFDDVDLTRSERYGFGIDSHLHKNVLGGIEISRRNLSVPITDAQTGVATFEKGQENLYKLYLYWTPHDNWSISTEPSYEIVRHRFTEQQPGLPSRVEMATIPLALHYFNPNGLFVKVRTSFVNQKLQFDVPTQVRNDDNAFITDAEIGYRLPRRYGVIRFEVKNLFNKRFNFQDLNLQSQEPNNPVFVPEITFMARFTLNF